jgi:hypothetical protein
MAIVGTLDRIGAFKTIWPKCRDAFHSPAAEFVWMIHWSLSPPLKRGLGRGMSSIGTDVYDVVPMLLIPLYVHPHMLMAEMAKLSCG